MLKSEVLKFFPEPVFKYKFEKAEFFNQELAQYIYNLQKDDLNGLTKSNRGGWHSKDFKFTCSLKRNENCFLKKMSHRH